MEPESKNFGRLLWAMALATLIGGGLTVLADYSFSSPTRIEGATWPGDPMYVEFHVIGQEPAVYRLPQDATIQMLFAIAQREQVPSTHRRLISGERVVVHPDGTISFGVMHGQRLLALGLRIPLNRAGPDDLMALPGIGERLAMKIVNFRDKNGGIASYDDLLWIPGLGPGVLKVLKRHTSL